MQDNNTFIQDNGNMNPYDVNNNNHNQQLTSSMGTKVIRAYQDNDVDLAIVEEREKEIKKINSDLLIVNEMFRYG